VLRYLVLRERPQRTIDFDPGLPLLRLIDEVDDATAAGRDERALALSRAGGFEPVGVPFKHLVVVAQAARFDEAATLEILERIGFAQISRAELARRLARARIWLERFAPEDLRFEVQETMPPAARELGPDQRRFLGALARQLQPGMTGQEIHDRIHKLCGEFSPVPVGPLFEAIYLALLGKPRGPRAGTFLAALGPSFCARRFLEAAGGS
jgi:lysyl-tRNA synthetase class 1